jgi:predicted NBD/HSP70 family sugar kinase
MSRHSVLYIHPKVRAPLDPKFIPAILANRSYRNAVAASENTTTLHIALERENGLVSRSDLDIFLPGSAYDWETLRVLERHIKCLVWARGGWKLSVSGPDPFCQEIARWYAPGGLREFDANLMRRVYEQPFVVEAVDALQMPEAREIGSSIGGHFEGCRIGFDLGASDYKLAAVIDGTPVFSAEIRWDPVGQADPMYHTNHIASGLRQAAEKLPHVEAIGGSSAGIYVANQPKIASLFRSIPEEQFQRVIKPLFLTLQQEWGVPLVVINDGDVTALAGSLSLQKSAMLGIAMGSSEAAGYLNPQGRITGFLNELAFAPVDFSEQAAADEWSGDAGVGALYFSQQAVNKLAPAAHITFPTDMKLPERLQVVQTKANEGDRDAERIFETIGVYLGYTLPYYAAYYDYEHVLILGRVTSGRGGEIILQKAKEVLAQEFPEEAERVTIHVPDEQSRRVGQAVAAASLPEIG